MSAKESFQPSSEECERLRQQNEELKETLRAIQSGEVDALFVSTPQGKKVYTLSSAEQPYRFLIEKMEQGAVMLLPDGRIVFANDRFAKMLNANLSDLNGKKIQEVFAEDTEVNSLLQQLNTTGKAVGKTATIFRNKENPLVVYISLGILELGTKMHYLIMTDITKDEQTRRLSAIGQTAGMVGHDIRNPLQAISSDVYLLNEYLREMPQIKTKDDVIESLNGIQKNVDYINKIVADLQDFARAITPAPQKTNLRCLCEEVLFTDGIPENVSATCKVDDDAAIVLSDSALLKRILANLTSNAIQAMPEGGDLSIRAWKDESEVVISIEDTGVGISEDLRSKIFTPMFTTKSKGQGFGLAVVKRMSEALGGSVGYESQVGKGTKFIVRLPQRTQLKTGSEGENLKHSICP
jgi:PAS domain S-box-containing protein